MRIKLKKATAIILASVMVTNLLVSVFASDFTVNFHANASNAVGSLNPSSRIVPTGARLTGTNAPPSAGSQVSRPGYVLASTPEWYRNPDCVGAPWVLNNDIVTSNVDLYLRWRALYNVTFDYGTVKAEDIVNLSKVTFSRHGTTYENQVAEGETLTQSQITGNSNSPRTRDLLFDAWYSNPERTVKANLNAAATGPINLFAGWLPANNVIFDLNYANFPLGENEQPLGGKKDSPEPHILNIVQVLDNAVIPSHLRPSNNELNRSSAGWNFIGWYEDPVHRFDQPPLNLANFRVPKEVGNLTLYAHWEKPIGVTFDFNFNGAPKTELAANKKPLSGKTIPVADSPTNPTNAQRKPNTQTCPYWNTLCGTVNACSENGIIPVNNARHGNEWSLDGWYTTPGGPSDGGQKWIFGADGTPVGTEDFTLYAHWVLSYEVTYELGIGTDDLTTPANYSPFRRYAPPGSAETTNTYTRVNIDLLNTKRHIQMGWYKAVDYATKWVSTGNGADVLTGDTTLHAGYLANVDGTIDGGTPAHILSFDLNHDPQSQSAQSLIQTRLVPQGGTGKTLYLFRNNNYVLDTNITGTNNRAGFEFLGWYLEKDGVTPWNADTVIAADMTVYAKWTRKINVQFHVLEGHEIFGNSPLKPGNNDPATLIKKEELNQGSTVNNPINASNENSVISGYTITGWHLCQNANCNDSSCEWDFSKPIIVTHEENNTLFMRLYVKTVNAVQLRFDTNWPAGSGEHPYGGQLTFPVSPTSTAQKYYLVYQLRPGNMAGAEPSYLKSSDTRTGNLNVPLIGEPPYQFVGWYKTKAGADSLNSADLYNFSSTAVTQDTTVYAGWRRGYAVSFDANLPAGVTVDVSLPEDIAVLPGTRATNPNPNNDPARNPQLQGYKFTTWYTDAACTTVWNWNTTINNNVTLYAGWVRTYVISFNIVVDGKAPDAVVVAEGDLVPDPELITRDGYDFVGWYRSAAGANGLVPGQKWDMNSNRVSSQMTLYAGWIKVHEVTFDLNYDTDRPAPILQQIWDGNYAHLFPERSHVVRIPPPMRDGWTFIGWYTEPEIDIDTMNPWVFTDDTVSKNTVLYAGWLEGVSVNPLWEKLDVIMAAAEANNGQILNIDMGSYKIMPKTIMSIIKGKNITLNLNLGEYTLQVSGVGITAEADRDRDLTVTTVYGKEPWILTQITKEDTDEAFDNEKNRPVWQTIISGDVNDVARSITYESAEGRNYADIWEYAILISRLGIDFVDRASTRVSANGNVTFNLSLGAFSNDFVILFNDEPSSVVVIVPLCIKCGFHVEECKCEVCDLCKQNPCICIKCEKCGEVFSECICPDACEFCNSVPCICEECEKCGERLSLCECPPPVCSVCEEDPCKCEDCENGCYLSYTVITPATCTADGEREGICLRENCVLPPVRVTIDKKGHNYGEWDLTPETCTDDGERTRTCANNGCDNPTDTQIIEKSGHLLLWVVERYPTMDEKGLTIGTCSRGCGHTEEEEIEVIDCELCGNNPCTCPPTFIRGDVDGEGGITIFDALEILKELVGMPSKAKNNPAALITPTSRISGIPTIFDALEILKKLVGMPSDVDN